MDELFLDLTTLTAGDIERALEALFGLVDSTRNPLAESTFVVNFNEFTIQSYDVNQDIAGSATVENSGKTLHLAGNVWKKIALPFRVTEDTVLEFDFKSSAQGQVHGIGFSVDDKANKYRTFQLYGTQKWGIQAYRTYKDPPGGWKHYEISVGKYFTGHMKYLTFAMDHDATSPTGEGLFRYVKLHPAEPKLVNWRLDELRTAWSEEDHPEPAPAPGSALPLIDPDLIGPVDIRRPKKGEPAYDLWNARRQWVDDELAKFQGAAKDLTGFDEIVETAVGVSGEDLSGWAQLEQKGQSKAAELEQHHLARNAFRHLVRIRAALENGQPVLESERQNVRSILVQVEKRQKFVDWRTEERDKGITLGPDHFRIPEPPPPQFPPPEPAPLPAWRATWRDRRDWQDKLQSRIDQETSTIQAIREAVSSTEEATLPILRDALVWATEQGKTLNDRATWVTDNLLIDAKSSGCQQTTRVAQAIETIQGLLWSLRTGQLDEHEDLKLDADDFDDEWKWIGSYATWRSAMFVFMYPENILMPSFRTRQTPAFTGLTDELRRNRRLTPQDARNVAKTYSDYFHDVCTLTLEATCQTCSRKFDADGNATSYADRFYVFARGGSTGTVYWSVYDPRDESGYAQSFWQEVPGLTNVLAIVGAVPFNVAANERYIYLFLRLREKASEKLVFTQLDLEHGTWEGELTELELPADATSFTAVVKQTTREDERPHLAIRLPDGRIFHRRLNQDGTDWEDREWRLLMGHPGGARFARLCAMIEFGDNEICLIVQAGSTLRYGFYGVRSDGWWHDVATGTFCGAVRWPTSSDIYVFFQDDSGPAYRVIQPSQAPLQTWTPSIIFLYAWLLEAAGANLKILKVRNSYFAGLTLYELLTLNKEYEDDTWGNPFSWIDESRLYYAIIEEVRSLQSEADNAEYTDQTYGAWKLASRYVARFSEEQLTLEQALLRAAKGQEVKYHLRPKADEVSDPFPALAGLLFLAPVAGGVKAESSRQFAYQRSGGHKGVFRDAQLPSVVHISPWFSERLAPHLSGPFKISDKLSEAERSSRRALIQEAMQQNDAPESSLTYLREAYYFVSMQCALELQKRGEYIAALDWFRTVYDYAAPTEERKIYYGLVLEESLPAGYERQTDWLLDPLDMHLIAAGRAHCYTRFTKLALARCFLEYADAEFTRDTAESVARARTLYLTALEILDNPALKQQFWGCDDKIGQLEIEVGDPYWAPVLSHVKGELRKIPVAEKLGSTIDSVVQALTETDPADGDAWDSRFAKALAIVDEAVRHPPARSLATVVNESHRLTESAHRTLASFDSVMGSTRTAAEVAAADFRHSVGLVAGTIRREMRWLREPASVRSNGSGRSQANVVGRSDLALVPASRAEVLKQVVAANPQQAVSAISVLQPFTIYPRSYLFCIPPNPIIQALRMHAELNLYKLRTCRNIAGQERVLDPYAAPTDTVTGLPMIGAGGQLVLPGIPAPPPTPYRYPY